MAASVSVRPVAGRLDVIELDLGGTRFEITAEAADRLAMELAALSHLLRYYRERAARGAQGREPR